MGQEFKYQTLNKYNININGAISPNVQLVNIFRERNSVGVNNAVRNEYNISSNEDNI